MGRCRDHDDDDDDDYRGIDEGFMPSTSSSILMTAKRGKQQCHRQYQDTGRERGGKRGTKQQRCTGTKGCQQGSEPHVLCQC